MKRRGFLGLFGAAAVAGPSVAKNALTEVMPLTGGSVMSAIPMMHGAGKSIGLAVGEPDSPFTVFNRIKELNRLLSGDDKPEEDPWSFSEIRRRRVELNVNALGSVSKARKVHMMIERSRAIDQERQRQYWLLELLDLQKGDR